MSTLTNPTIVRIIYSPSIETNRKGFNLRYLVIFGYFTIIYDKLFFQHYQLINPLSYIINTEPVSVFNRVISGFILSVH